MEGGRIMRHPLTRREAVKSMTGAAIWASMTGRAAMIPAGRRIEPKISVKVPPPGPRSLALLERTKKALGRTNYAGLYSICLATGDGVHVQDLDGNVYLDCLAAASSNILGYGRDEVAQAYYEEASRMQHTCLVYSANEPCVRLAESLNRLMPADCPRKTILGLTGSDSNEGAIEAARKYTGRSGIISFRQGYHGSNGLSQAASGFPAVNSGIYPSEDPDFIKIDFPERPRIGTGSSGTSNRSWPSARSARSLWNVSRATAGTSCRPRASSSVSSNCSMRTACSWSATRSRAAWAGRAGGGPTCTRASCRT